MLFFFLTVSESSFWHEADSDDVDFDADFDDADFDADFDDFDADFDDVD